MCGSTDHVRTDAVRPCSRHSDLEILESLFANVMNEHDRMFASTLLIKHFGSLARVLKADEDELSAIWHLPDSALQELTRTRLLMNSIMKSEIDGRPLLDNYKDVCRFGRAVLGGKRREEFHAIFLDESFYLLGNERLQTGTVNHVSVYPRELMSRALRMNASHIILIHNHPGGSEHPSLSDIEMTRVLIDAGRFLNITILDHIIIGMETEYSFRKNGLISARRLSTREQISVGQSS